jgi:hypothetical protein
VHRAARGAFLNAFASCLKNQSNRIVNARAGRQLAGRLAAAFLPAFAAQSTAGGAAISRTQGKSKALLNTRACGTICNPRRAANLPATNRQMPRVPPRLLLPEPASGSADAQSERRLLRWSGDMPCFSRLNRTLE